MADNITLRDEDTETLLGEFLETFLGLYSCPWKYTVVSPFIQQQPKFITDELRVCIARYQTILDQSLLRIKYKNALGSSSYSVDKRLPTDTGLPLLQTLHLDYLIQRELKDFSTIVALFFLIANLTLENYRDLREDVFIHRVVGLLSAYLTRTQLEWVQNNGGWSSFCNRMVVDLNASRLERDCFRNFTDVCVHIIFTGKFGNICSIRPK